jgi:tetratricopeptide (TPR) repeat protein
MAALIAHEITHYYEKHAWGNDFATAFTDLDVSGTVKTASKSIDMKATNETEADYLGGFLAYSAGFQTFGVMPRFLVDVYAEYDLPDNIPGYPSLDDRSKLAVESEMKLEELIHVFDAANYMVVLQQYDVVNDYYSYILKEFQSREIYNNAGVNAVMAALQLFNEGDEQLKYSYPIQLDGETRMSKPKVKGKALGFAEKIEKRNKLLEKAKFYFEQTHSLDAEYATGFINLACVHDLMGSYEEADFFATKAARIARENNNLKVEGDAYIILGIVAIHEGEVQDVSDYFKQAAAKDKDCEPLAQLNMGIYNGTPSINTSPHPKISLTKEQIEDTNLDAFIDAIDVDILLDVKGNVSCGIKLMNESKILLTLIDGGQSGYTLLHLTNTTYGGATGDGIKIGASKDDVLAQYGNPTYIQEARQGQFLVYNFKNIAFFINNGQVQSWALYRVKTDE